ncbi:hypothetical protein LCGC14_1532030 [marine sediment metagenome]|uniref:Uncharacterized protein n=1 Tax=marine sediment metagenome TaxID=412755 RepID=A0A0F9LWI9_9ZZZZ
MNKNKLLIGEFIHYSLLFASMLPLVGFVFYITINPIIGLLGVFIWLPIQFFGGQAIVNYLWKKGYYEPDYREFIKQTK